MKVGVIGTGLMGRNHVRVYSELKTVEEVYIFDPDSDSSKGLEEYGAIPCTSTEEMLDKVEAVSICVPTEHHRTVATEAVERGVHFLLEKPITASVEEGQELLALLKHREIIAGVGHIERFNPIVEEMARIVKEPVFIDIRRHNPDSARVTESSVVEDLMIHDIDILMNVFFKECDFHIQATGNRDVCKVTMRFDDSIASLSASRMASKKIRTIYIESRESTIEGDFMNQEIFVYRRPDRYTMEKERYLQENIIEKVLVNKVEPLKLELKTFIDCVRKGESFPVTPGQALMDLKICEEIRDVCSIL